DLVFRPLAHRRPPHLFGASDVTSYGRANSCTPAEGSRQNALEDKGAELAGTESSAPAAHTAAATASRHADCDGSELFATICIGDVGTHSLTLAPPQMHTSRTLHPTASMTSSLFGSTTLTSISLH